jgi:hypothetical protein
VRDSQRKVLTVGHLGDAELVTARDYISEMEDIPRASHSPKVEVRHTMLMIDTVSRNSTYFLSLTH